MMCSPHRKSSIPGVSTTTIFSPGTIGNTSLVEQSEALVASRKRFTSVSFNQTSSARRKPSIVSVVIDRQAEQRRSARPALDTTVFQPVQRTRALDDEAEALADGPVYSPSKSMDRYYHDRIGALLSRWINLLPISWRVQHVSNLTASELHQVYWSLCELVKPEHGERSTSGSYVL